MTTSTTSTWRLAAAVMVGVLAAAAVLVVVWQVSRPSEFDCAVQRTDAELGNIERWEVDQSCR